MGNSRQGRTGTPVRTLSRFLRYLVPQLPLYLLILLTTFVAAGATVLVPYVTGILLIDHVIVPQNLDLLPWVLAALAGVLLLNTVTDSLHRYLVEYARQSLAHRLRTDAYTHVARMDVDFFERNPAGDVLSRVVSDVDQVDSVIDTFLEDVGMNVVLVATTVFILYAINPSLTFIVLPTLLTLVLTVVAFKRTIKRASSRARKAVGALAARAEETFLAAAVVKAFCREQAEVERFRERSLKARTGNTRVALLSAVYAASVELSVGAGMVLVVAVGTPQVLAGAFTVGAFVAYLQYLNKLYTPVKKLARANFKIQKAFASADRIFELLDEEPRVKDGRFALRIPAAHGTVRFENVSFSYPGKSAPVLRDVNLELRPGEVVALAGSSGAGKSTIAKLLLRFHDPTGGRITLDGVPLSWLAVDNMRSFMAVVPQETILFSGTVRENIAYGMPDATAAEIEAAARGANAHDFIQALPDGYDTYIGERGVALSGGQRQRISIARALLRNPRILILDEATSNVDPESEALIQEALARLMAGRTTLLVAHRATALLAADRVAIVENGRIARIVAPGEAVGAAMPVVPRRAPRLGP